MCQETFKAMKHEALKRLTAIGVAKEDQFLVEYLSTPLVFSEDDGHLHSPTEYEMDYIADYEQYNNNYVYMLLVLEYLGTPVNIILYVSDNEEDWACEAAELENGIVRAHIEFEDAGKTIVRDGKVNINFRVANCKGGAAS